MLVIFQQKLYKSLLNTLLQNGEIVTNDNKNSGKIKYFFQQHNKNTKYRKE